MTVGVRAAMFMRVAVRAVRNGADGDGVVGFEGQQGISVGAGTARAGELPDKKGDEGQRKQQADGEGKGNNVHGRGRVGCANGYHAP